MRLALHTNNQELHWLLVYSFPWMVPQRYIKDNVRNLILKNHVLLKTTGRKL